MGSRGCNAITEKKVLTNLNSCLFTEVLNKAIINYIRKHSFPFYRQVPNDLISLLSVGHDVSFWTLSKFSKAYTTKLSKVWSNYNSNNMIWLQCWYQHQKIEIIICVCIKMVAKWHNITVLQHYSTRWHNITALQH